jgi:hypothetical protein
MKFSSMGKLDVLNFCVLSEVSAVPTASIFRFLQANLNQVNVYYIITQKTGLLNVIA